MAIVGYKGIHPLTCGQILDFHDLRGLFLQFWSGVLLPGPEVCQVSKM
jgi:hypothetical protein